MAKQKRKLKQPKESISLDSENPKLIEEVKEEPNEVETPISSETLYALPYFISEKFNTPRQLFLKFDPSNNQALIISNIPPFVSEKSLELLLSTLVKTSRVKTVFIKRSTALNGNLNEGYRTASAIFESSSGVEEALTVCESSELFCLAAFDVELLPHGVKRFVHEYNSQFKSVEEIQESVNTAVKAYDEHMLEQKAERKLKRKSDEDGWISVTREDKHVFFAEKLGASKGKVLANEREIPDKKKRKFDLPFYVSESKESKLTHMQDLQRKFEEDKKRIAQAQAARKFKP